GGFHRHEHSFCSMLYMGPPCTYRLRSLGPCGLEDCKLDRVDARPSAPDLHDQGIRAFVLQSGQQANPFEVRRVSIAPSRFATYTFKRSISAPAESAIQRPSGDQAGW